MGIEANIQILFSAEIQNSLFFIIYTRKSEKYVTCVQTAMKSAINFGTEKIGFKQFFFIYMAHGLASKFSQSHGKQ